MKCPKLSYILIFRIKLRNILRDCFLNPKWHGCVPRPVVSQPLAFLHLSSEAKLARVSSSLEWSCTLSYIVLIPIESQTKSYLGTRQYYIYNFTLLKYISGESNETQRLYGEERSMWSDLVGLGVLARLLFFDSLAMLPPLSWPIFSSSS